MSILNVAVWIPKNPYQNNNIVYTTITPVNKTQYNS